MLLDRKNTLMVLTHLILNDMVKTTGQIADIAFCLVDAEPRIADLARLFFHELNAKVQLLLFVSSGKSSSRLPFFQDQHAIYNILPDTIGTLSNATIERESDLPDAPVSEVLILPLV